MIRAIGAILLICGTAAWGFRGVLKLRGRCRSLAALTQALSVMQSEICGRLTPMPELLNQLSQEADYPACLLFKNAEERMSALGGSRFSLIWRQAVSSTPELLLTEQEKSVLQELGVSLGKYNADEQKNALEYTRRRMEDYRRRADSVRDSDSKLHAYLGVAAGIFAVVILI